MVQINLGGFETIGGKTVGSGLSSSLDAAAIIQTLVDAKQIPVTALEETLTLNSDKSGALGQLSSVLGNLKTAVDFLRNPPGFNNASSNIFEFRTATLGSTTTALTATASAGSALGTFDIAVGQLARARSDRSEAFASQTADITESASGATTTLDFTTNLPSAGTAALGVYDFSNGDIQAGDTLTIGAVTFNFIANGTESNGTNIEVQDSNIYTLQEIAQYLNGTEGQAQGADVARFDYTFSAANQTLTLTGKTGDTSDNAVVISANIANDAANGTPTNPAGAVDADTITIGGDTYTFGFNGTDSRDNVIETGTTLTETLQNIVAHLNSANGRALGDDVDNFTYSFSGTVLTATSTTIGGADDALDFSASIAAGAPTVGGAAGVADPGTAGTFSAGTFSFSPTVATSITATTDITEKLFNNSFTVNGTGTGGTFTAAGIQNIDVGDLKFDSGQPALQGVLSGFTDNYDSSADTLIISVDVNGVNFVSAAISTAAGGGSDSIAAGQVIKFYETDGTTFEVQVDEEFLINDLQANVDTFIADLETELSGQTILQDRTLSTFRNKDAQGQLKGLEQSDVTLRTDDISPLGSLGTFSAFTITHNGVNDNDISVDINGDTYSLSGQNDTLNTNIVLTATDGKQLQINLADAGVSIDLSSQNLADTATAEFDRAFGTRSLTDIVIDDNDSLADIRDKINTLSSTSGVSANIIQVSSTDFRITLQSNNTGLDNDFVIVDDDGVTSDVTFSTTQVAKDAIFAVDGIVINRSNNAVTDVVSGVTFNLAEVTNAFTDQAGFDGIGSPTLIEVTIEEDVETAVNGVINFVNAFNEFRVFTEDQQRVDDEGSLVEGAFLGNDTTLRTISDQLLASLSVGGLLQIRQSGDTQFAIRVEDFEGDLETPAVSNTLQVDQDILTAFAENNFDAFRQIFELTFSANSNEIVVFETSNSITLTDFTLDIDPSRAAGEEVHVLDSDGTFQFFAAFNAATSTITGVADTGLEGLTLLYTGTGQQQIDVNLSQGNSDYIFNLLDSILDEDGVLQSAADSVITDSERINTEIDKINEQIEIYRNQLLIQYAALEEAVARSNSILELLEAQNQFTFAN